MTTSLNIKPNPVHANNDPVFDRMFEIIFPVENEVLTKYVSKMERNVFGTSLAFNLLIDEQCRLVPLKELIKAFKFNMFRQDGKVFLAKTYHECRYVLNWDPLHYHDYASPGIKELTVAFHWGDITLHDEEDTLIELQ